MPGARDGTGYAAGCDHPAQKIPVPKPPFPARVRDDFTKVVLEVRREPELTRTELTKARWTHCRRQQQIDANPESNTKCCGKDANAATTAGETAGSIERSGGSGKGFSWHPGVGLFPSGHDRKMTENRACGCRPAQWRLDRGRGQALEKRRNAFRGVADSQKQVRALGAKPGSQDSVQTIRKAVNSISVEPNTAACPRKRKRRAREGARLSPGTVVSGQRADRLDGTLLNS